VIVSTNTYNRGELTKQQKDFLVRVVPLAIKIQEWTKAKANFMNIPCPRGVLASITISDIILASEWGNHPIAKAEYGTKYSNNLVLREPDPFWKGKTHTHGGVKYCAFRDWRDIGIFLSDHYVFSRLYDLPLLCTKEADQIKALSLTKPDYQKYIRETTNLIDTYFFSEFNH
jgi:hypothetical protein